MKLFSHLTGTVVKGVMRFFRRFGGIFGRPLLAIIIISVFVGIHPQPFRFLEQCKSLWFNPGLMIEELIQSFPFLDLIPYLSDILNTFFAGKGAVSGGEAQFTIFKDLYFTVFSVIIIRLAIFIYDLLKKRFGRICSVRIAKICDLGNILLIAYFCVGIAFNVYSLFASVLFKDNYIIAFFVLIGLQIMISSVDAIIGITKKSNKSGNNIVLRIFTTAFMDILFQVSFYSFILNGYRLFSEKLFNADTIVWFIFSGAVFIYTIFRKADFAILKKREKS